MRRYPCAKPAGRREPGALPRARPADPPRRGRGTGGAGGEEFPRGGETFVLSGSRLPRYITPKESKLIPAREAR